MSVNNPNIAQLRHLSVFESPQKYYEKQVHKIKFIIVTLMLSLILENIMVYI